MRIGVYTSCLQDLPIEEVLPLLADLGLDSVEVNVGGFIPSPHIPIERVLASADARRSEGIRYAARTLLDARRALTSGAAS